MIFFDKIKALFNNSDTVAAGAQLLNIARRGLDTVSNEDLADHVYDNLPEVLVAKASGREDVLKEIVLHAVGLVRALWSLRAVVL